MNNCIIRIFELFIVRTTPLAPTHILDNYSFIFKSLASWRQPEHGQLWHLQPFLLGHSRGTLWHQQVSYQHLQGQPRSKEQEEQDALHQVNQTQKGAMFYMYTI
jgi:hypothetical protein